MNDLLTVEQLAQRLQVSRTTVFSWLKTGTLQEGAHYFRLGRVIRFHWPLLPLKQLPDTTAPINTTQRIKPKAQRGTSSGINLDYC